MNCGNCGNENATRMRFTANGQRCNSCAFMRPFKKKKVTSTMLKYAKSRYTGPDGHVKCDPKYKPAEHYLGS